MLVYIEFISRRPGVGLHEFHAVVGGGQTGWSGDYADDVAVLNLGRSWRMGPEPEYLCAWYSRDAGMERIDEWERVFRSGVADHYEEPFRLAGRIDRSGCYDPLLDPVVGTAGRYYAEWFDVAGAAPREAVVDLFEARRKQHPDFELNLLVDRIGKLGPDPRGLAVWGVPSWAVVAEIARDLDEIAEPIRLETASFYADFGQEQL